MHWEIKQRWDLLLDKVIIDEVVQRTDKKLAPARKMANNKAEINEGARRNKKNVLGKYRDTNFDEINGYIKLLLLASIYKASKEDMRFLFSTGISSRPIFRAVMSAKRFEILSADMRFENPETTAMRRANDIFGKFVKNS